MAEGVDTTSTQASLEAIFNSTQSAGSLIHIETSDGEPVLTFESAKEYASIVFSSPDLESGATYDVYLDRSAGGEQVGGLYSDGSEYTGGSVAGVRTAR